MINFIIYDTISTDFILPLYALPLLQQSQFYITELIRKLSAVGG